MATSSLNLLKLAQLGIAIDKTNIQFMSLTYNGLARLCTNSVANHASILTVLHHKHVKILHCLNREVLKSRRSDVLGLAVTSITLVRHRLLALVAAADGGVLTAGLAPAGAQLREEFITMTCELLAALLDDCLRNNSLDHSCSGVNAFLLKKPKEIIKIKKKEKELIRKAIMQKHHHHKGRICVLEKEENKFY